MKNLIKNLSIAVSLIIGVSVSSYAQQQVFVRGGYTNIGNSGTAGNFSVRGFDLNAGETLAIIRGYYSAVNPDAYLLKVGKEGTSNWEKFVVKGNGRVGIGKNDPDAALDISTTVGYGLISRGQMQIKGNTLNSGESLAIIRGYYNALPSDSYLLKVGIAGANNWERFVVRSEGNVAIGTTDIINNTKLTVNEVNGNRNLELRSNNDDSWMTFHDPGNNWYSMGMDFSDGKKFKINAGGVLSGDNTGHFVMDGSGKIALGTSVTSAARLTVVGGILTDEVTVESISNGPDYVFEADYELSTLEEVEAYVKANKHLPEVPSAKEMEENGIELAQMNMLLLMKIEELTLYLIELKKQNDQLREDVEKIKNNNE